MAGSAGGYNSSKLTAKGWQEASFQKTTGAVPKTNCRNYQMDKVLPGEQTNSSRKRKEDSSRILEMDLSTQSKALPSMLLDNPWPGRVWRI
jgi:uncharacterized Fe-S cluster-containing radical SAM superfamily protein